MTLPGHPAIFGDRFRGFDPLTTPYLLLLLALAAVALVLAGALLWLRGRPGGRRADGRAADHVDTVTGWSPQATRVLSGAERDAFDVLRSALPAHTILAQVPLARFIKVPTRNSYSEWLRRVGHQCADFVVCDRHAQVLAVVELQPAAPPPSERAARRQRRFQRVLQAAGVTVHFWKEGALPSPYAAREAIAPSAAADDAGPAGAMPMPLNPAAAGAALDDSTVLREPPPSTWFDDLETEAAPLDAMPARPRATRG